MSELFYLDEKLHMNNDYFGLLIIEGLNCLSKKYHTHHWILKVVGINMLVKQAVV